MLEKGKNSAYKNYPWITLPDISWHLAPWDIINEQFPQSLFSLTPELEHLYSYSSGGKTLEIKLAQRFQMDSHVLSISANPCIRCLVFSMPHLFIKEANKANLHLSLGNIFSVLALMIWLTRWKMIKVNSSQKPLSFLYKMMVN